MTTKRFFAYGLIAISMLATSCGSSRKSASKALKEVEIEIPFKKINSDKTHLRAMGTAVSSDMNTAKKLAIINAKSEIAATIQTIFDEVNTVYFNQYMQNATVDMENKFEGMSRTVVSQVLTNVDIIDQKYYQSKKRKENDFRCYVLIEMAKSEIGKKIEERISAAAKDNIDMKEEQYREIFREALDKYSDL